MDLLQTLPYKENYFYFFSKYSNILKRGNPFNFIYKASITLALTQTRKQCDKSGAKEWQKRRKGCRQLENNWEMKKKTVVRPGLKKLQHKALCTCHITSFLYKKLFNQSQTCILMVAFNVCSHSKNELLSQTEMPQSLNYLFLEQKILPES